MFSGVRSSLNPKLTLNLVLRDSIQNLTVPTAAKTAFIKSAANAGVKELEPISMTKLPSMQDAVSVFRSIKKTQGCLFTVLVPNMKGFEKAEKEGVRSVSLTGAVSNTFSQRNIRMNFESNYSNIKRISEKAKEKGIATRIYVSCCFGCEFEGALSISDVVQKIKWYREIGDELVICDSTGEATPEKVDELFSRFTTETTSTFGVHFHGPRALDNTRQVIRKYGVTKVDVGVKGLGGCTALTSPKENLPMTDMLNWCSLNAFETGIDYFAYKHAEKQLLEVLKGDEFRKSLGL